jgi:protocatechuate 3,4-dioxygenase beta subunit
VVRFTRFPIFLSIILLAFLAVAGAQTPARDGRPRTASISGRVTVGGAPAANALVMVAEVDPQSRTTWPIQSINGPERRAFIKVRADGDGRYHVTGLTDGAYLIRALSKAYTAPKDSSFFDIYRSVTLDEGESRDNVDIALVRGGVITGRVTDAEGSPLMGAALQWQSVDENGKPRLEGNSRTFQTDDRGVYRIYGLPAGRYILSAGGEGARRIRNRVSPQTFYPDVTDEKQAKIIEVKDGAEVTDIDIRLGAGKNTYEAVGRVVDAETGQPLPRVSIACAQAPGDEKNRTLHSVGGDTDDEGKFRVAGLSSGRYELSLQNHAGRVEHYSEKTLFEVGDSDVSGLEVKAIRGSTVSGVVVIEGASDPSISAKLPQMGVTVSITRRRESVGDSLDRGPSSFNYAKIASDGGFRLTGLTPGVATFQISGAQESRVSIKRVERDGVEIRSALEIGRGEHVAGVRVVMIQANGTIRGQVEIAGGELPEGGKLYISAAPIEMTTRNEGIPAFHGNVGGFAEADEKGRFVIERLVPGEYELRLTTIVRVGRAVSHGVGGMNEINQRVIVKSGVETTVKLTLDLSRK